MDVVEKLKQRAEEIPQEVADRENEASSHCGPYGTETAADYMDDYDRLLMLEAATELTALRARVAQLEGALRRIELNAHTTGRIAIRDEARQALGGSDGRS